MQGEKWCKKWLALKRATPKLSVQTAEITVTKSSKLNIGITSYYS